MNRRGFTLIEMLVATSIFSIAALALGSSLRTGVDVWRRTDIWADAHQESRSVLDQVAGDLRRSIPAPKAALDGTCDTLSLWTLVPGPAVRHVVYSPGESGRPLRAASPQGQHGDGVPLTVSPATLSFSYTTADEPFEWVDSWNRADSFPRAVRVVLAFADSDIPSEVRVVSLR